MNVSVRGSLSEAEYSLLLFFVLATSKVTLGRGLSVNVSVSVRECELEYVGECERECNLLLFYDLAILKVILGRGF